MIFGSEHAGAAAPFLTRLGDEATGHRALLSRRIEFEDEGRDPCRLAVGCVLFYGRRPVSVLNLPEGARDREAVPRPERMDVEEPRRVVAFDVPLDLVAEHLRALPRIAIAAFGSLSSSATIPTAWKRSVSAYTNELPCCRPGRNAGNIDPSRILNSSRTCFGTASCWNALWSTRLSYATCHVTRSGWLGSTMRPTVRPDSVCTSTVWASASSGSLSSSRAAHASRYSLTTVSRFLEESSYTWPTPPPDAAKRSAIRRLAFAARSQAGCAVGDPASFANGTNSGSPARAPDARTLTRQRPIEPGCAAHCCSTSRMSAG